MQTEEWMKRKKEELRVTKAHAVFKEQVTENTKELEQRNGNLLSDNECNSSTVSVDTSLNDFNIKEFVEAQAQHIQFNTRLILKLEKRVKELEERLRGYNPW